MAGSRGASPYLMACPAGLLLLIYAFLNGFPFFYPDSFVYFAYGETAWQKLGVVLPDLWPAATPFGEGSASITAAAPVAGGGDSAGTAGQDDWTPAAGRSIYYGLFSALPGIFSPPWNGILVQAYCSALAIAFAWRAAVGAVGMSFLAAMAALGVLSTFGIFASTAMPDVWAAIGILSLAVLISGQGRTGWIDRIVLWAFVLFAAVSHSSHLAVLAILAVLCALVRLGGLAPIPWPVIARLFAVLVLAVGLGTGAKLAMERAAGNPPLGLPFLTGHLVDGGPGMGFIRDACPEAGFAVCERADQLPVEWRIFILRFAQPADYRRRLVEEDLSFALATLRHDPSGVLTLALRDAARQSAMIGLVTTPIRAAIGESHAAESSDSPLARKVREGRLYHADRLYRDLSAINAALVLAGLAVLGLVAVRPGLRARIGGLRPLLGIGIAGFLTNAAVCGTLASPYDRFQARVAWLIPVLAVLALAASLRGRRLHLQGKETTYQ